MGLGDMVSSVKEHFATQFKPVMGWKNAIFRGFSGSLQRTRLIVRQHCTTRKEALFCVPVLLRVVIFGSLVVRMVSPKYGG